MSPTVGDVYAFQYEDEILPLVVTEVNDTHVFYKFPDSNGGNMEFCKSYHMCIDTWIENKDSRVFIGTTSNKDALKFMM